MRRRRNERGFVLLMVLLVLVISATVLAATARRCGQDALRAAQAQRQLQWHWGALSIRAAALPRAEQLLLQERDARPDEVVLEARRTLVLGDMRFVVLAADEAAKADANALWRERGSRGLSQTLQALQADASQPIPVRLRPQETADEKSDGAPATFRSLDAVVALPHPRDWVGTDEAEGAALRRRITCWGGGKLNVARADLVVLHEVLAECLTPSQIADLDALRRQPDVEFSLAHASGSLGLTPEQLRQLKSLATDTPGRHSLWIRADGGARSWSRLYVEEDAHDRAADDAQAAERTFDW
jgi:hypothetical protein